MYKKKRYVYKDHCYFVIKGSYGGTGVNIEKLIRGQWAVVTMMGFSESRKMMVRLVKRLVTLAYKEGKFITDISEIDRELQRMKKERKRKDR